MPSSLKKSTNKGDVDSSFNAHILLRGKNLYLVARGSDASVMKVGARVTVHSEKSCSLKLELHSCSATNLLLRV